MRKNIPPIKGFLSLPSDISGSGHFKAKLLDLTEFVWSPALIQASNYCLVKRKEHCPWQSVLWDSFTIKTQGDIAGWKQAHSYTVSVEVSVVLKTKDEVAARMLEGKEEKKSNTSWL